MACASNSSNYPHVIDAFEKYSWPGNIRELENLMERAYILEFSPILTPKSFPDELFTSNSLPAQVKPNISLGLAEVRRTAMEQMEKCYLKELLAVNKG